MERKQGQKRKHTEEYKSLSIWGDEHESEYVIATYGSPLVNWWVNAGGDILDACFIRDGDSTPYFWNCGAECGHHIWQATVAKARQEQCPFCARRKKCACAALVNDVVVAMKADQSKWRSEVMCRCAFERLLQPHKFPKCKPLFLGGLELDGYCAELHLAFEYQGGQHYEADHHFHKGKPGAFEAQVKRDSEKRAICKELGIELIEISDVYSHNNPKKCVLDLKDELTMRGFQVTP